MRKEAETGANSREGQRLVGRRAKEWKGVERRSRDCRKRLGSSGEVQRLCGMGRKRQRLWGAGDEEVQVAGRAGAA